MELLKIYFLCIISLCFIQTAYATSKKQLYEISSMYYKIVHRKGATGNLFLHLPTEAFRFGHLSASDLSIYPIWTIRWFKESDYTYSDIFPFTLISSLDNIFCNNAG